MKLLRDVICQVVGKGQGCPIISAKVIESIGLVPLAKGGGGAPVQNVTQNSAPWSAQQPYLTQGFARAQSDILNTPQTFFPGQTYTNFSPQTANALNLTEQRALAGSPVQHAANNQLQGTLNGDYLHGGAGFDAAYEAARNKILPDIQSRYAQGGRFGSGLGKEAEASALADAFASQYGQERQNQLKAAFLAPQAAQTDYQDLQALLGVGGAHEDQEQLGIDEAMQRHRFEQEDPRQRLRDYMALIQGNYGQQGQQQVQGFRGNRGAGILGGALGGAQVGGQFGGGWGALGGGLLGGLAGLI